MADFITALGIFGNVGFLVAIVAAIAGWALVIAIAYFTGGAVWTMLWARIRGSPLLLGIRNDGRAKLITGQYIGGYLKNNSGIWQYHPKKDSNYPFYGNTLSIGEESLGTTIPKGVLKAAGRLKEAGFDSYEDMEEFIGGQDIEEKKE